MSSFTTKNPSLWSLQTCDQINNRGQQTCTRVFGGSKLFWGRKSWGKFLVNETFEVKQSLPCQKATLYIFKVSYCKCHIFCTVSPSLSVPSWYIHSRLWRCPSRRLLRVGYPLLPLLLHLPYLRDQDLAGERMSLVAHCPGLPRPLAAASLPSFTSTVASCMDQ